MNLLPDAGNAKERCRTHLLQSIYEGSFKLVGLREVTNSGVHDRRVDVDHLRGDVAERHVADDNLLA